MLYDIQSPNIRPTMGLIYRLLTYAVRARQYIAKKNRVYRNKYSEMDIPSMNGSMNMHGSASEHADRAKQGFPEVEGGLPHNVHRHDVPIVDDLSSLLGKHNPIAKEADPERECVWLLDNIAYRPVHPVVDKMVDKPKPWQAEFVATYFVKNTGKDVSKWVADIADKLGYGPKGENRKEAEHTIAQRLLPFVETIQPARWVNVEFPNGKVEQLGPAGRNAISSQVVGDMGEGYKDGDMVTVKAVRAGLTPYGSMLTHFAEPEGWLVVSGKSNGPKLYRGVTSLTSLQDIDDTIKITMTASPLGILASTFVDPPTPIRGMPELYARIHAHLSPTWFYLSASPYNLYPFLRSFLHTHYPKGTAVLRDATWQNLSGILQSLTEGTERYKDSRIVKIQGWLPSRKVLCTGDSTQSDPEVYGDMYRKFGGGWIKAVFIRKVTGVAEIDQTGKNSDERFEKAFRGVPREIWRTFTEPEELYDAIDALKK